MSRPDVCIHGNDVNYIPVWDEWLDRLSREGVGHILPLFCPCRPPNMTQSRLMEETIQLARDARVERERFYEARSNRRQITPAPGVEKDSAPGRWYLITFTQPDTLTDPKDLLKRTLKVIKSKMVSPNQWCYSLELTEKGTPHTHIRLHTDKYFDYKKVGNFNAGYRYDVQVEKFSTADYVVKEDSKPSEEWLARHGLTQFVWYSDNYSGPKFIFSTLDITQCPASAATAAPIAALAVARWPDVAE